jgi:nitrogen fixation NifU-like protein
MTDPDCAVQYRGSCGDAITYYLRLQGDRIRQIRFTTTGCDATYAAANMLASMVRGLSLQEAEKVTPEDLLEALDGLPPKHIHCATLSVVTLQQTIQACRKEKTQS